MPMSAIEAVAGRRSIRCFSATPVSTELVLEILEAASRAPSGVNAQPWLVHVVTGPALKRLSDAAVAAQRADELSLEYPCLPTDMREPYRSRRQRVGYQLYELYGIDRADFAGRKAAMLRNFSFFGAPVGLFFTMDRDMTAGSWLDMGMFMQNVMTVARAHGLETCPQQSWCDVGGVVHRELGIPKEQIILSGMALGHPDLSAPVNSLVADRVAPAEFARIHDR